MKTNLELIIRKIWVYETENNEVDVDQKTMVLELNNSDRTDETNYDKDQINDFIKIKDYLKLNNNEINIMLADRTELNIKLTENEDIIMTWEVDYSIYD